MDIFSFVKDCLLKYNYPLVHSMSEEEIADIFKTSNRCFLISWMLKLLDSTYEEVLENLENDKEFLGNIVCDLGFCTKKEKLPFMIGGLPVTQQVKIIYNIFTYITDIKKCPDQENVHSVTNDDLKALVDTDLNLFPMYGDIKVLRPSERALKKTESEKEVDTVNIDEESTETEPDCTFSEDIQEFLVKLKALFPKIRSSMETMNRSTTTETDNIITLEPDLVETLKKCSKNLKIISQFTNDINTIENFDFNYRVTPEQGRNNNYEMVKALHKEVLTILKYNRCL